MFKKVNSICGSVVVSAFALLVATNSWSVGYVEMPKTTEVPTFEKDSMLLDMDVPPLRDRDPDPTAGPRLNVKEFRLQGLVEYPKLGITREKLIHRVESIRFDLMKQDEIGKWGYTEHEVSEIADMMGDIESEIQDEHVGAVEVQKLVFLIREQRRKRGVTLGMIESVADVITQFYRENGFILAKAYIPEQKVRDGVVTLTLLLGDLGGVSVSNNKKRVSEKLVKRAFKPYIDEPVTSDRLEEALYLVNDIPGLSARSVLAPGSQVGDTHLNVNIQQEKWYSANLRADNFGSETTSKNRLYSDFMLHNPSGLGDEIYVALLKTYSPDNSSFGALRYSSFWGLPRLRTSMGYSTNDFVSRNMLEEGDNMVPQFLGESKVADISVDYYLHRQRVKNISIGVKYMEIDTVLDSFGENAGTVKQTSVHVKFDFLNQQHRQLYLGDVGIHSASSTADSYYGLRDLSYTYLTYDLSMLMFPKIPFTEKVTRLLLRTAGQYAGTSMSNVTQFNVTGVGRTRLFGANGFQGDDGMFIGADWLIGLPKMSKVTFFGKPYHSVFQPYLFADYGYAKVQPIDVEDTESLNGRMANYGAGLKVNYDSLNGNVFFGKVLIDNINNDIDTTPTSTVGVELSYSF